MAVPIFPQKVADAFVEQYYVILNKCPESLHKFYQESSLLGWPGPDGALNPPVTTLSGINDKIMSSDYKNCLVEIKSANAQESLEGGVFLVVDGFLIGEDNLEKAFNQSFFLAKQEKGYFVLNDILRFPEVRESTTSIVVDDNNKDDRAASSVQVAVPSETSDSPAPQTDTVAKEENVKAALDTNTVAKTENVKAAPKTNTVAKNENVKAALKTDIAAKSETVKEALDVSNSKDDAKAAAPTSSTASHVKVPSVSTPAPNTKVEAPKLTYASMVAKERPLTPPETVKVSPNTNNQMVAPSTTKPLAVRGDIASKASSPSSEVSKASAPPSNVVPKSQPKPTASNGVPNTGAHGEARGIYIGGLPHDITKQGVVEVVKRFGPVRRSPDSIQIRRHEDGFCCGFVEFESPDAARRAVEVHHVKFGDKEAYITYKRSSFNRGNDGRGRSPSRGGFWNGNSRGRENGEVFNRGRSQNDNRTSYDKGQARGSRRNRPSDQWSGDEN